MCSHGGFWTCADNYNPGHLVHHKWEDGFTLDLAWGYRRDMTLSEVRPIEVIIENVVEGVR